MNIPPAQTTLPQNRVSNFNAGARVPLIQNPVLKRTGFFMLMTALSQVCDLFIFRVFYRVAKPYLFRFAGFQADLPDEYTGIYINGSTARIRQLCFHFLYIAHPVLIFQHDINLRKLIIFFPLYSDAPNNKYIKPLKFFMSAAMVIFT